MFSLDLLPRLLPITSPYMPLFTLSDDFKVSSVGDVIFSKFSYTLGIILSKV